MHILHIITRLIVGGAQENTLLTCEGLRARGHQVTLLTGPSAGPEGSLLARAQAGGYQVMVTPHLVRNPHPYHDHFAYHGIKRLVGDLSPDVVHTHSSKAGILGRVAAWRSFPEPRRPRVVHTIHGLPFHPHQSALARQSWTMLERYAARRCHAIICVADAMTRQALAAGVGRPEQYATIYSGMDVEPFVRPKFTRAKVRENLGIASDRLVFGTIARLQPLKGHDDLLATAGAIFEKVPNAHYLWIGNGVFRERFEAAIRQNGWTDRFTFTGLVPPEQVPELLPAMDILVHPSYREGLARALPQALLAGLPVISYDCDGAGEVAIPGQTGALAPTGDAAALCDAMTTMAQAPARLTEMGARGRALCLERFSTETMVDRIDRLYHDLLRQTSADSTL